MPSIDISRDATDYRKHYQGVSMQQGRVLTDDDFNEAQRLDAEDARLVRRSVIGPAGSPDNGFRLKVIEGQVLLTAGTYYVGGLRLELEKDELFTLQRDWLQQGTSPGDVLTSPGKGERNDFIWLDVWQQPVSAVEDKELFEVALGGADTSARIRTMRRARVLPNIGEGNCAEAWTQLVTSLSSEGRLTGDFELVPDARLTVSYDSSGKASDDLCSPPMNGGYLGAENQAIRVQIVRDRQFTWGFDNGAPLYRVKLLADDAGINRRIQMLTIPKDQAHYPLEGQVVELLPWSALLSNGQKNAELSGFITTVAGGYNPDTQELFISEAPSNDAGLSAMPFGRRWTSRDDQKRIANEPAPEDTYFYMRVWNRGADTTSPAAIDFAPGDAVSLGTTGLTVTFSGTQFRKHDFWILALRPETPTTVVPWELTVGRAPHGVRRWIAPLGILHWLDGKVEVLQDCRPTFLPLTRMKGCCSYTVGDGTQSFGNFSSIQAAIDALPPSGGRVCVLPGRFEENVLLPDRSDVTLVGCGPRSRLVSQPPSEETSAAEPVVHVKGGRNITIESLAIEAHETGFGLFLEGADPQFRNDPTQPHPLTNVAMKELSVQASMKSAIRIDHVNEVDLSHCRVTMTDTACLDHAIVVLGDDLLIERNIVEVPAKAFEDSEKQADTQVKGFQPGVLNRGGIQIGGTSERVRLIENVIRGGAGNGITLGSLIFIDESGKPVPLNSWPRPRPVDPCDPKEPADSTILVKAAGTNKREKVRSASAGTLSEIVIERNRISAMGMNGIGVVGFFDLREAHEIISVVDLSIHGNEIRDCLRRPLAAIPESMMDRMGYGGIAIADVDGLVIRDNVIVENGPRHEPVCGIFVLQGEGIEISRNRIVNSGTTKEASAALMPIGRRGGIHIIFALEPKQKGEPALKVYENVVNVPIGSALSVTAIGPVVVEANHFTSRGIVQSGSSTTAGATTVAILNLGLSHEFPGQFLTFSAVATGSLAVGPQVVSQDPPSLDDQRIAADFPNGNVLFAHNQCLLNVAEPGLTFSASSIAIYSLDDVSFHGNQSECRLVDDLIWSQTVLFGMSLRAVDNRFKESVGHATFSAVTLGFLNMTTNNQSTHCLLVRAAPGYMVDGPNMVLVNPFGQEYCKRFSTVQSDFGKTGGG